MHRGPRRGPAPSRGTGRVSTRDERMSTRDGPTSPPFGSWRGGLPLRPEDARVDAKIPLQAGPLPADLLEDFLTFARIPDDARRDQQEELGPLDPVDSGPEQEADDRDLRQVGNPLFRAGPPRPDEPAEHQGLVIAEHDGGLGFPL